MILLKLGREIIVCKSLIIDVGRQLRDDDNPILGLARKNS